LHDQAKRVRRELTGRNKVMDENQLRRLAVVILQYSAKPLSGFDLSRNIPNFCCRTMQASTENL